MISDRCKKGHPAVFLDRDGTINVEVEYLSTAAELELIPGAPEGIRSLNQAGFLVIVITNQSGVARGLFDEERVWAINRSLEEMLARRGARIDAWYYCPHHPEHGGPDYRKRCSCRKPATGMVEQACRDFPIDLAASCIVGDSMRDVQVGWQCGMKSVLVRTGHGEREIKASQPDAISRLDCIARDIRHAAEWILSQPA